MSDREHPTELLFAHHWRRRCRAAIFFVYVVEKVAEDRSVGLSQHIKDFSKHLWEISAGRIVPWSRAMPWIDTRIDYALEFSGCCNRVVRDDNGRAHAVTREGHLSGSLRNWFPRGPGILALGLEHNFAQHAVVEAISTDMLDDAPDPGGLQDALRALLVLGRLAQAEKLADARLPKPAPVYRNEAPIAQGRYTPFGRRRA